MSPTTSRNRVGEASTRRRGAGVAPLAGRRSTLRPYAHNGGILCHTWATKPRVSRAKLRRERQDARGGVWQFPGMVRSRENPIELAGELYGVGLNRGGRDSSCKTGTCVRAHHTPLLFMHPALMKPHIRSFVASQPAIQSPSCAHDQTNKSNSSGDAFNLGTCGAPITCASVGGVSVLFRQYRQCCACSD